MSQASVSSLPVPGTHSACLLRSCPARVQAMLASTSVFDSNGAASRRIGARKALLSNTPQIYFLERRLSEVVRIGGSLLRKALTSRSSGLETHGPCLVRPYPARVQAMLSSTPVFDSNHAAFRRSDRQNPLLSNNLRQKQLSTPDPSASLSVHLRPSAARISWSIPIPFPRDSL